MKLTFDMRNASRRLCPSLYLLVALGQTRIDSSTHLCSPIKSFLYRCSIYRNKRCVQRHTFCKARCAQTEAAAKIQAKVCEYSGDLNDGYLVSLRTHVRFWTLGCTVIFLSSILRSRRLVFLAVINLRSFTHCSENCGEMASRCKCEQSALPADASPEYLREEWLITNIQWLHCHLP